MSTSGMDKRGKQRRRQLVIAAGACVVGAGLGVAEYLERRPRPPAGEPLSLDIGSLAVGKLLAVEWQKHTVWVLRRSDAELAALAERESELADPLSEHSLQPAYCRNRQRALRADVLVVLGECTHQGCTPQLRGTHTAFGEFLCPCHTSKFDLAGRVFRDGPAKTNLTIPEYRFEGNQRLVIGVS